MTDSVNQVTPSRVPPHLFWPGLVILLFVISFTIAGVTIFLATNDPAFHVESDYYEKAIDFDAAKKAHAAARSQGWTLALCDISDATVSGLRTIAICAQAGDGQPVSDASLQVVMYHSTRPGQRESQVVPGTLGRFGFATRLPRDGEWIIEASLSRDDARLDTLLHFRVNTDGSISR